MTILARMIQDRMSELSKVDESVDRIQGLADALGLITVAVIEDSEQ